ncbi:hypothetical protein CWC38_00475 [Kocuria tytonicola]|uniref:hypothetical protein n=1 Tax=Kocuria tytonicola TaxID=2055946 RepID=UPI000EF8B34D|nr:hypothetical protein [Kocuria tytonicola]RLZ04400.1 hypothetical protein CWC38_00475 [Kocuria tytonicola]
MKIGYPIAVVLALLGLAVLLTEGFGAVGNPVPLALALIVGSLVATMWQRHHDRRKPDEEHHKP